MSDEFKQEFIEQKDHRLGRQLVHDPRSLSFPMSVGVDRATWRSRSLRVYDPRPNPNQPIGCCTGVAKAVQFNAAGNRKAGQVLDLDDAIKIYSLATSLDVWEGAYPPDDTGSSGLASCKAAEQMGLGGVYRWLLGGADEVVQAVVNGEVISVGTWWYQGMFSQDDAGVIKPTGSRAGGHQYVIRGYDLRHDRVLGRCWWGPGFRDFWLARGDLADLLADDGDAHWQAVVR